MTLGIKGGNAVQLNIPNVGRSASVKALTIGVLIIVLLIPTAMIKGVVHDRQRVHDHARGDIQRSWGYEQLIAGPVLVVPYRQTVTNKEGREVLRNRSAYVLPTELTIEAQSEPVIRYRGLHKVPIYTATVKLVGSFPMPDTRKLGLADATPDWDDARVAISVSDARAIAEIPEVRIGGEAARFEPGGERIIGELAAPIAADLDGMIAGDKPARFSIELTVKGSDALRFLPLADTTRVTMNSTWPDPSFVGNYLPESHRISADGFGANWRISSLGRALPSQWHDRSKLGSGIGASAFGVTFYMPVSLYQTTLRATKYAVLFIAMSFVAYFLFEILAKLRLHPLQYLLVGFANALFYLLLLSLAEHVGFALAYWASAAASTALIAGYSGAVLGGRRRGLTMAAVLGLLYGFLYMTLKAESFALLGGALGLWIALATIMWVTRHIDWYGYGQQDGRVAREPS
jgi:inner membrane protein